MITLENTGGHTETASDGSRWVREPVARLAMWMVFWRGFAVGAAVAVIGIRAALWLR